jgi:regulator of sigma E protease
MMGEDETSEDERAFGKKKVWQRILVIAGGPAMNILTAILIFVVTFMVIGASYPSNEVGVVTEGQAAQAAGMLSGDVIVEISGRPINTWNDIISGMTVASQTGQAVNVVVLRNGENIAFTIPPYFEDGRWLIGIQASEKFVTVRQNFFSAIDLGAKIAFRFTKMLLSALVGMLAGTVAPDVTGPVGVVGIISQATADGLQSLLLITAILCLNLAVINLLPIPALDGSRIVFLLLEWIRGKPLKPEREGMVHFIGLMLLIGLILVVTYNDIAHIIERSLGR